MKKLTLPCLALACMALLSACSNEDEDYDHFGGPEGVARFSDDADKHPMPGFGDRDGDTRSEFDQLRNQGSSMRPPGN